MNHESDKGKYHNGSERPKEPFDAWKLIASWAKAFGQEVPKTEANDVFSYESGYNSADMTIDIRCETASDPHHRRSFSYRFCYSGRPRARRRAKRKPWPTKKVPVASLEGFRHVFVVTTYARHTHSFKIEPEKISLEIRDLVRHESTWIIWERYSPAYDTGCVRKVYLSKDGNPDKLYIVSNSEDHDEILKLKRGLLGDQLRHIASKLQVNAVSSYVVPWQKFMHAIFREPDLFDMLLVQFT